MDYKKISELTEVNNHTEARIEIAKELFKKTKDDYYLQIFKAIQSIQYKEKHLPFQLSIYRDHKTIGMLSKIKDLFGIKTLKELEHCI